VVAWLQRLSPAPSLLLSLTEAAGCGVAAQKPFASKPPSGRSGAPIMGGSALPSGVERAPPLPGLSGPSAQGRLGAAFERGRPGLRLLLSSRPSTGPRLSSPDDPTRLVLHGPLRLPALYVESRSRPGSGCHVRASADARQFRGLSRA